MLTDNIVELVLHQIAKDKGGRVRHYSRLYEDYPHKAALEKALRRSFDAKVKFARLEDVVSEEMAQSLTIAHDYRNEVYHIGLHHEDILIELAAFHFDLACQFLGQFKPGFFGWTSGMRLPDRSLKYFKGDSFMPGSLADFEAACVTLRVACGYSSNAFIQALADHMDTVISEQDSCIDTVASGVYEGQQTTRDLAVINTQVWRIAFTDEGRAFQKSHGFVGETPFVTMKWLEDNYPVKFRGDPIASWERRAEALHADRNAHAALNRYHSFMVETADLRETLCDSALAAENEIDAAIDRARGL